MQNKDGDENFACSMCVGESHLSDLIESQGEDRACSYCNADGRCISVSELADHVEGAFTRHFYRTSDQPDSFQMSMLADKESSYEWERDGEPVLEAIASAASIDDAIARDVLDVSKERHSDLEMAKMGEECEFDSESRYEWKRPDDLEFQIEWHSVARSLRSQARFFNADAEAFFGRLFGDISNQATKDGASVIVDAGPDLPMSSLYRARVFHNDEDVVRALERPDLQIAAPPSQHARAGRMNAKGISVFYGAGDAEVAVAEVRPPVGSRVIVGRFDIIEPVRLLDIEALRSLYVEGSFFNPDYLARLELAKFLGSLSHHMTIPVMPDDEPTEYLVTQIIAEYLSRKPAPGLDGMIYPSVQQSGERKNVVLFNHASRTEEWAIPEGTAIDASTYSMDEDGGYPDYYVSEETPPVVEEEPKDSAPFDFLSPPHNPFDEADSRTPTLRLDPESLVVRHVQGVTFQTETFAVRRHRYEKHEWKF